jgi:hypothetical protein
LLNKDKLKVLKLYHSENLKDETLEIIISFKKLEKLKLTKAIFLSKLGLEKYFQQIDCKFLKELDL